MGFDPARDLERWRRALAATSAALLVVLIGFGLAEWRAFARDVVEQPAVTNVVERCPSCHQPPAAHGAALEAHQRRGVGCSDCHGGRPRGLRLASVHFASGVPAADPRLRAPGVDASCMRCHVPGGAAGTERLGRGARLYLGLGCAACHPLGAGGAGYAPDLSAVGWRSPAELRARLLGADPPPMGSPMPSFAAALREPTDLDDLLVFLEGLALAPVARGRASPRADALVSASCTACHEPGAVGPRHRCLYLRERVNELACERCHVAPLAAVGRCPVVDQERSACPACHPDARST